MIVLNSKSSLKQKICTIDLSDAVTFGEVYAVRGRSFLVGL